MNQFRKNGNGEWVVFGTVSEVRVGAVQVQRKDQSVQTVTVESLGRPFSANGKQMVYGYIAKKAPKAAPKPAPVAAVTEPFGSPVYGRSEEQDEMAAELAAEMAAEAEANLSGCDVF